MSSEDESMNFIASDSESDFEQPVAKKATKAAPKKAAPKEKAAPKPKAAPTKAAPKAPAAKKTTKKAQPLSELDNNVSEQDAMSVDECDVEASEQDSDEEETTTKKTKAAPKASGSKDASEQYQKLSQLEHVLKRPDTYIGSIEATTLPMWVFDKTTSAMTFRNITYVPGLYKIFDEILVNAADNKQNDATMNLFKVKIDREAGTIEVYNNGKGIPVEIHKKEGIWIPELIFGHLLTSSNYDDEQKKVTGGRNGYGAKLANIYSTEFIVETADKGTLQKYKQVFSKNMSVKGKPKITENKKGEEYTRITFKPDFKRFGMDGIDDDTEALMIKRVYDMAGCVQGVKVHLNGTSLSAKVGTFKKYVEMYASAAQEISGAVDTGKPPIIYEKVSDRWEIAFTPSEGQFNQISFVNSIATTKGGTHVDHVAKQLVEQIIEVVKKKNKAIPVKPFQVKSHLWVFVNCLVENPAFDSQTKEHMTLAQSKFGSKCKISEDFTKKVIKSGVVENVLNFAKYRQDQVLKKADGSKKTRITGIAKLEDANKAGTKEGHKCTLILTEGDSAKALAVSGIGVVGRDYYGVFPLRGKLLNVRDATGKALLENAELQAIKQIIGLQHKKVYEDTTGLRYGHLMIMTDQDHDGSHIKGLIINFLECFYPSLLKCHEFLVEFVTPIVKVTKGKKEKSFFTIPEFETWKEENDEGRGWDCKYYKGLGTSTASDAKKYFSDMKAHRIAFKSLKDADRGLIDMAFNKKKADERKEWLRGYEPGTYLDHNVNSIPISDFVNKELILFSMADNVRSIPSMVDGFKPGQRKVLFGCFKRKLKKEIKVAQLSGYVAEHSAYHHGEVSLVMTIVGLAQAYVGSNNLNILDPNGQFGTRLAGGKDAASARYIFTNISKITRTIFHPADDALLTYLNDDGDSIEPSWYLPILPMVLVNGCDGIGTGWSTSIPNYNPKDIVDNLMRKMNGQEMVPMLPWFRSFEGLIEAGKETGKYKCSGIWEMLDDDTMKITELPIRVWTQTYKELLEGWLLTTEKSPALIREYKEYHTDTTVDFTLTLTGEGKKAVKDGTVEKVFKLANSIATTNMVCFDLDGKIKKYNTPEEILEDFYDIRFDYYQKRKAHLLHELNQVLERLSNQARFVLAIIEKTLLIERRRKADIVADMRKQGYKPIPKLPKKPDSTAVGELESEEEEVPEAVNAQGKDSDFDYCLQMALSSLTKEKVDALKALRDDQERQITDLTAKTTKQLWQEDLKAFLVEWEAQLECDRVYRGNSIKAVAGNKRKTAAKKTVAAKKSAFSGDEEDSDAEFVAAPKKKKTPVKKKAAPVVEPSSLPHVSQLVVDSSPAVPAKTSKKRASPTQAKQPAAKKSKVAVASDDESDAFVVPAKGKAKAAPKAAVKAAAKPKAVKKAAPKSDLEMSEVEEIAPRAARTARTVTKPKSAYVDLDLSEDEAEAIDDDEEEASDFEGAGSESD